MVIKILYGLQKIAVNTFNIEQKKFFSTSSLNWSLQTVKCFSVPQSMITNTSTNISKNFYDKVSMNQKNHKKTELKEKCGKGKIVSKLWMCNPNK